MSAALVFALIGGAGFLTGIAALLQLAASWKATRTKGSADAYQAWQTFMGAAVDDREAEHTRVLKRRDELYIIRGMLIDLVQALIAQLRAKGVGPGVLEPYQDRLDDIRTK